MKKHFVKVPVDFETPVSAEAMKEKIDGEIAATAKLTLYKYKGQPMWFWRREGNSVTLRYCEDYRGDMCDIAFTGELRDGLSGCQLDGVIRKPSGVWAIFWIVLVISLIVAIGLPLILSLNPDVPLYNAAPLAVFLLPVAYIEAQLLMFDSKKLRAMNEKLREFTLAENIDLLADEYDENSTDCTDDGENAESGEKKE